MSEHNETEKSYWSKEVADLLGISTSTLRKWSLQLEACNYEFLRDDQERRAFTERDVMALRMFRELTKEKGVSLENAANAVVSRFSRDETQERTPSVPAESQRSGKRYETLLEEVKATKQELEAYRTEQQAFNQALLEELKKQREYIENSVKVRDEQLMKTYREIAAAEEEKKKKPWFKFW